MRTIIITIAAALLLAAPASASPKSFFTEEVPAFFTEEVPAFFTTAGSKVAKYADNGYRVAREGAVKAYTATKKAVDEAVEPLLW